MVWLQEIPHCSFFLWYYYHCHFYLQVPFFEVLSKFDALTFTDVVGASQVTKRRYEEVHFVLSTDPPPPHTHTLSLLLMISLFYSYELLELPPFLIFHLARFTKNKFFTEKNPTIVTFPVKNLDLGVYLQSKANKALPSVSSSMVLLFWNRNDMDGLHQLNKAIYD